MANPQNKQAYNPFTELADIRDQKRDSHSVTQGSGSLAAQSPKHPIAKSQNPEFVKLTAYVPKDLHRATKARLVEQGREISGLVEELVADWLKKQRSDPT